MNLFKNLFNHYFVGIIVTAIIVICIITIDYFFNGYLLYPEFDNFATVILVGGVGFGLTHFSLTYRQENYFERQKLAIKFMWIVFVNQLENNFKKLSVLLKKSESKIISECDSPVSKKVRKNIVGVKTKADIKSYLENYGSINLDTCIKKFNVRSLRNFIYVLRKDGLAIKTEKVGSKDSSGKDVVFTNYLYSAQK